MQSATNTFHPKLRFDKRNFQNKSRQKFTFCTIEQEIWKLAVAESEVNLRNLRNA